MIKATFRQKSSSHGGSTTVHERIFSQPDHAAIPRTGERVYLVDKFDRTVVNGAWVEYVDWIYDKDDIHVVIHLGLNNERR